MDHARHYESEILTEKERGFTFFFFLQTTNDGSRCAHLGAAVPGMRHTGAVGRVRERAVGVYEQGGEGGSKVCIIRRLQLVNIAIVLLPLPVSHDCAVSILQGRGKGYVLPCVQCIHGKRLHDSVASLHSRVIICYRRSLRHESMHSRVYINVDDRRKMIEVHISN